MKNDLAAYFLKYSYVIKSRKEEGIFFGPSRGSSAGSLLCYLLEITEVDPIKWNLSFARFLNEGRVANGALPDIDTDVQKSERKDVIRWMKEEFGEEKVHQVVNFNTFKLKSAIKAISRALEIDFSMVNAVTKKMDDDDTLEDLKNYPEATAFLKKYPEVNEFLPDIYGLISYLGVHAGGIIMTPKNIENYMGTLKIGNTITTCWDKRIEDKGFVKLDLLGLNTLDIIKHTLDISGAKLPKEYNDQEVFEIINKSPLGIFQVEKAAGMEYIKKAPIQSFSDLYNATALIRPGSKDTGDTARYIERLHDPSKIKYDHEDLEPILGESKGIILFQEQQQSITKVIAGFSDTESDDIRRAIGKKKLDLMESYHSIFISRSIERLYEEALAVLLWSKIEAAANYSFNKSHAVGYSMISYFCAWLKTYYPSEFMTMAANFSKKDKRIKVFGEMKREGIVVELPNVNLSEEQIAKVHDQIVLGLELIDGVGPKAMEDIIEKRPFYSFRDFIERKDSRRVNKKVVQALVESGALDQFGRRDFLAYINKTGIDPDQTDLFGKAPVYETWTTQEMLFKEYQRIRLSPNQNLIDFYDNKEISNKIEISKMNDLDNVLETYEIYVKALISDFESKGDFGYLTISDGESSLSIKVSGALKQEKYFELMNTVGEPILAKLHFKYGKPNLDFLIDLGEELDFKFNDEFYYLGIKICNGYDLINSKYKLEWDYINDILINKVNEFSDKYSVYNWGILTSVSYFTSKKGTRCCSFGIKMDKKYILKNKLICRNVPDNLTDGTLVGFFVNQGNDFIDLERVVNVYA